MPTSSWQARCFEVWPRIEFTGPHQFKYRVDFDQFQLDERTAALCVSRPTNPTGNVLTDDEIHRLSAIAKAHGIFTIDNAYGAIFPNVIFSLPRTPRSGTSTSSSRSASPNSACPGRAPVS